jgi:hypothetical protein
VSPATVVNLKTGTPVIAKMPSSLKPPSLVK